MGDFLTQCMADLKTTEQDAFKATFCDRCRNTECQHAKWAGDKFAKRISSQEERLLNPKNQIAQAGTRYEEIKDFVDSTRQAIRLEIVNRRGDWAVPGEMAQLDPMPANFRTSAPEPPEPPAPVPEGKPEAPEEPPPEEATPEPELDERPLPVLPPTRNTPPPPPQGLVVGEGPVPVTKQAPPPPKEDWTPKPSDNIRKVLPGAKIKMGG